MHVLVPLVAALVPLLITPGLLANFDITPKIVVLLLGLSLILLYPAANLSNVRLLLRTQAGRLFAWLIGLTWLAGGIATAFSAYPLLSLNGSNWRRYGFIVESAVLLFAFLAGAWLAADQKNIRILLRACVASGALAAIYGIAQYFGFDPLMPATAYQIGEVPYMIVRPPGTLGHADYFAAWLEMITFLGFALARMEKTKWLQRAALSGSIASIVAIVLSGTRSAMLGLLAGAIVLAMFHRKGIGMRWVTGAAVAVFCGVFFFVSPAGAKLRARVHWSTEDVWGGARPLLWRDSLRMALHRPVTGFAPETFATEFPRFESADLARAYPDFYHESPHNIFLDALTSRGAGGLLLLLAVCLVGIWRSVQRAQPEFTAALVASLLCMQFVVFVVPTALYFYLLIAMVFAEPRHIVPERKTQFWIIPVALAASLLLAGFAVRLLVSDRFLAIANQRIASGDAAGAAGAYGSTLRWQPAGSGADLNYSRAMAQLAARTPIFAIRLQASRQALDSAIRATRTAEDRQNAWYNLATLLAGQNDAPGVERSLRNAIAWSPNWFKPRWALAQLLEATNRHHEALNEAGLALYLDAGRDSEVSATWEKIEHSATASP
jgi:O-antigen ligase